MELSFEEHRVYDLRRWKIATQPEFRDIYGYYITKLKSGTYDVAEYPTGFKYEKRLVQQRVFEQISEIAIEYKTGARSLRGIFEELMTPILYVLPDNPDIGRVLLTSLFEEAQFFKKKK